MPKVSVTIITRNEAAHIRGVLESVAWADEIVVVDSESTDDTAALARAAGARVSVRAFRGYGEQKNHAASLAAHDWILSVDADERVSSALAEEIARTLAAGPSVAGYRIPRVAFHLGRWIRSTDWYPDYQLRLYDRRRARWSERPVHESVAADGRVGRLRHELLHYAYRDLSEHLDTIDRYSTLAARDLLSRRRRAGPFHLVVHPALAFLRNYVARGGLRDGTAGLIVSLMNAYYVLLKFAKLWELGHTATGARPGADRPAAGA